MAELLTAFALLLNVEQLGSPRFFDRCAADDRLREAWPLSAPIVLAGQWHTDAEISWRCRRIWERKTAAVRNAIREAEEERDRQQFFKSFGPPFIQMPRGTP